MRSLIALMRKSTPAPATPSNDLPDLPAFPGWKVRSYDEYARLAPDIWNLSAPVCAYQSEKGASGRVRGFSAPAGQFVDFEVHRSDAGEVNWRESLVCPITGLNNRTRAAFHLLASDFRDRNAASIFLTEQTTPLFRHVSETFPGAVGSEYLPHLPLGSVDGRGFRNEDLTDLTFRNKQFDAILTCDVLEHVPDYAAALRECARVLKPGGRLYITVPFNLEPSTLVRARRLPSGEIDHLLEPEYHGDPIGSGGVLCYYHFGFDLLDSMRAADFSDAYAMLYGSIEFGYLGVIQRILVGVRST